MKGGFLPNRRWYGTIVMANLFCVRWIVHSDGRNALTLIMIHCETFMGVMEQRLDDATGGRIRLLIALTLVAVGAGATISGGVG